MSNSGGYRIGGQTYPVMSDGKPKTEAYWRQQISSKEQRLDKAEEQLYTAVEKKKKQAVVADLRTKGTNLPTQVVSAKKKLRSSIAEGGASSTQYEVIPSDYAAAGSASPTSAANVLSNTPLAGIAGGNAVRGIPSVTTDYYRLGSFTFEDVVVSTEDVASVPDVPPGTSDEERIRLLDQAEATRREIIKRVQVWKPVPLKAESYSDDYNAKLASIRLVHNSAVKVSSHTSGTNNKVDIIPEYTKFFLETMSESYDEKYQFIETFGETYAFFYGERPKVFTFSGYLLNLSNYNWLNEFTYFYDKFWRGTKAVSRDAQVYMNYNYQQISGYVLNMRINLQAATDKAAPFSISVFVTDRTILAGNPEDEEETDQTSRSPTFGTAENTAARMTTTAYMQGKNPAAFTEIITDSNKGSAVTPLVRAADSTQKQLPPGGNAPRRTWFDNNNYQQRQLEEEMGLTPKKGNGRAASLKAAIFEGEGGVAYLSPSLFRTGPNNINIMATSAKIPMKRRK